jgi:hypothetical protein
MRRLQIVLTVLTSAVLLGGCGGGSATTTPFTNVSGAGSAAPQSRAASVDPDACDTNVKESIKSKAGVFKLPACDGITGKITYGANDAGLKAYVTLASSPTSPDSSSCGSTSGETPILFTTSNYNSSKSNVYFYPTGRNSTLKSKAFSPSATYSFYVYLGGSEILSESLGSPNNHGLLTFASPLNGATVPTMVTICTELDTP